MSLTRKTMLLAKIETTSGVDALPVVATDFIPITSITIDPNVSTITRELFRDSLSPVAPVPGKRYITVTFSTDIVGNGLQQDGATEPFMVRLFEACKCLSTATAESAVGAGDGKFLITPSSAVSKSLTLYVYIDGILYKVLGAKGTPKITIDANVLGKLDFTFTGLFASPSDTAMPSIPTVSLIILSSVAFTGTGINDMTTSGTPVAVASYLVQIDTAGTPDTFEWSDDGGTTFTTGVAITGSAQLLNNGVSVTFAATTGHTVGDNWTFSAVSTTINPPIIKSIGLTLGASYVPILSSFEVDLANKVIQRDDMNAATGVSNIEITGREPTGSLNPDLMLAAQYDVWTQFLAMTPQSIVGAVGSTAGNIFEISIPEAIYDSVGIGDRDGVRIYDIKFTPTGSDNEVALTLK